MTDHLSSSPALAGAASKRVKAFFHFSPQKKEKSKRGRIFYLCFFFFFLERQKRKGGENVLLKQRSISTGLPSMAFGGWLIFQDCFFFFFFDNRAALKPSMTSESVSGSPAFRDARQNEE